MQITVDSTDQEFIAEATDALQKVPDGVIDPEHRFSMDANTSRERGLDLIIFRNAGQRIDKTFFLPKGGSEFVPTMDESTIKSTALALAGFVMKKNCFVVITGTSATCFDFDHPIKPPVQEY